MNIHTVVAGESLVQLAEYYGFAPQTIWSQDANAELRAKRSNMNVLVPGDRVVIPEKRAGTVQAATGCRHVFRRRGVPAMLRIVVLQNGKPRAGQRYVLTIDGVENSGTANEYGVVEQYIAPSVSSGRLVIGPDQHELNFRIGHLQPVITDAGVEARLRNLGFLGSGTATPESMRAAVSAFQRFGELAITGELDEAGRAALEKAHDERAATPASA